MRQPGPGMERWPQGQPMGRPPHPGMQFRPGMVNSGLKTNYPTICELNFTYKIDLGFIQNIEKNVWNMVFAKVCQKIIYA